MERLGKRSAIRPAPVLSGFRSSPITYKGVTHAIGHLDNVLLYPGLALGAIVSRAGKVSDGMLVAAARAVSSLIAVRQPVACPLPQVDDIRGVSATVAVAVAEAAVAEGLAVANCDDIVGRVRCAMWQPEYPPGPRRLEASRRSHGGAAAVS